MKKQREPALHKKLKDELEPGERLLFGIKGYLYEELSQTDRPPFFLPSLVAYFVLSESRHNT